jgi:hydrogenase nickel incorporation protein HypA/HybF
LESNSLLFEFLKKHMMRELDLTQTFLDKALRHIHETRSRRATTLHIALGEISELDQASLQTHWSELSKGTPAEHAQLHFRLISAEVQCMACFQKYHPVDQKISCPYCGSVGAKILTGEECTLESIETENE